MNNIATNKGTVIYCLAVVLIAIVSCGQAFMAALPPSQPAVSVQITTGYCPSVEVKAGMQISWTNLDDVDRALIIERTNKQGSVTEAGGTSRLHPGDTFSVSLTNAGQYTYYCSRNRGDSGEITVRE